MRIRPLLAAALALVALGLGPAPANAASYDDIIERGRIIVAVYRDYPPFSSRRDGELVGVDIDLAREMAGRLNLAVEFMELTAGETVDDDLRNGVWKGHYLERRVADVMMHIPTDRVFALRNAEAVVFAPYFRERVVLARDTEKIHSGDGLGIFAEEKVGVELDSLADHFLTGWQGGRLIANVVHFPTVAKAAEALGRGEVAAVLATESELAAALGGRFPLGSMEMPGLAKPSWELGLAVKESNRQLAYALEDVIAAMRRDGAVGSTFRRHGLPYAPPEE